VLCEPYPATKREFSEVTFHREDVKNAHFVLGNKGATYYGYSLYFFTNLHII